MAKQRLDQLCRCREYVLGIVEHEENLARLQMRGDGLRQLCSRFLLQTQRRRDRLRNEMRVRERTELDEPHAIGEVSGRAPCNRQRESRLAHPSGPGQRDQTVHRQQRVDFLPLPLAPDQ